jgi:hypothetical protein
MVEEVDFRGWGSYDFQGRQAAGILIDGHTASVECTRIQVGFQMRLGGADQEEGKRGDGFSGVGTRVYGCAARHRVALRVLKEQRTVKLLQYREKIADCQSAAACGGGTGDAQGFFRPGRSSRLIT